MIGKNGKKPRTCDAASQAMIDCACDAGISLMWDRLESQEPQCGFGRMGICCRHCFMGPCRIDPFGQGPQAGICGADADVIVARGLLRHVCAGTAAHSDHGRDILHALAMAAEGKSDAYKIRGPRKLRRLADEYGIPQEGRSDQDVAKDLAHLLLAEFGKQEGALLDARRAPEQQRKNWAAAGITPRGIDREVVTGLHTTHIGADNDSEHLLMSAVRVGLADGWGGSMIATDLSDVLFGEPHPLRSRATLGALKADQVTATIDDGKGKTQTLTVPRSWPWPAPRGPRASTWPASAAPPTRS